ncbi:site-specific integrase [Nitrospiraceae bacterium AH_259_D15_M11_P09]|nr:site-specific integrase [Nitrospiraceae bacterium AH_259_D15_M11_P09]
MGSVYRRTVVDEESGKRVEIGPFWIKYYRNGRPFRESTATLDRGEARRKLKQREGEIAEGRFRGLRVERTRFEHLAEDLKTYYRMNKTNALQRAEEAISHLATVFHGDRATELTSDRIHAYIARRQQESASNGTINRETGMLKRMFALAMKQTPPKVLHAPYIPHLHESNIRSGFFEHEDFLALRGALPDYAKVAITLAYYSGMRMGEVCSLTWDRVSWTEGKLYLKAQDTKTREPRVLYLTGDLWRVLEAWKPRCVQSWPSCAWICHRNGVQLQNLKSVWRRACQRVGLGQMVQDPDKERKVWQGRIPHDFRRTAIRNMVKAGVPEKIAMAISGHKTRSVFNRYNIIDEGDLKAAADRLSGYFSKQMGTISGTIAELDMPVQETVGAEAVDS